MRWRRLTAFVLGTLATAYVVAILLVQRRVLFPMPHTRPLVGRPPDSSQVWLSTAAGAVEAWYLPPLKTGSAPAPVLVFFHGNGELIDFLPYEFQAPRQWGMGILLV